MSSRFFLICGLCLMATGVALGAFGAHALKAILSAQYLSNWQTATQYLFYHALGLIGLGLWTQHKPLTRAAYLSGILMLAGIVLFSGSLYLLVLTANSKLGMITPLGGLSFILAWISWVIDVAKSRAD